jgi:glycosyltransferase involved in cell wall biosynthesis
MSIPLVSVVIPAYNAERTLRAAVASVRAQTVQELELIVVDDGSEDSTAALARSLPKIRVISQPNQGVASARNSGLAEARAEWVAFLDADDIWIRDKLRKQLQLVRENPKALAVQTSAVLVNDQLDVLYQVICPEGQNSPLNTLLFRNLPAFSSSLFASRRVLNSIGGFDSSLVILEDWDLAVRLSLESGLFNLQETLVLYRIHGANRSRDLALHIQPGFAALERIFASPDLPEEVSKNRSLVYGTFFMMLAGGAFRSRNWTEFHYWARRAIFTDPRSSRLLWSYPFRSIARHKERGRTLACIEELRPILKEWDAH